MSASPAFAQDVSQRINRLENEIQTLSRAVFKGEQPPVSSIRIDGGSSDTNMAAMNAMNTKLAQLEQEVRRLTGKLEQQDYELRRLTQTIEAMQSGSVPQNTVQQPSTSMTGPGEDFYGYRQDTAEDMQAQSNPYSLGTLAQNPNTGEVSGATIDGAAMPASRLYDEAFGFLQQGDYDEAASRFDAFVASYPSDRLAPNARFWLGESYYALGEYEEAAKNFARGYQDYPASDKAPESLLKLAITLGDMGDQDSACVTLQELSDKFPAAALSVKKRADTQTEKLGCQV